MIDALQASWALFHTTYIAGGLIALLLAVIGVWVVARDQIFLGLAVSQASTLGIAVALWLGGLGTGALLDWLGTDEVAAGLAVLASVATALLTARAGGAGRESPEAITGWVYLVAASVAVLLVANSPHGLEEVHRLVFSTLLAASTQDLWVFGALAVVTLAAAARWRSELVLFAMDPEMAAAVGLRTRTWNAAIAIWLGLGVGLSIRVSGMLYTVGCLVLPALIAKNLCREVRPLLAVAPLLALAASLLGFAFAHVFDLPPAHTTVALLCGGLAFAWGLRRLVIR
ncbi:MAG: metal ABC transporter permease [Deltaproteobacteria bacterium]|nr:MAG: metal ABC transporter permease [Deltaproteobacteria bacterium]